jgi:hypothetical protein
MHFSPRPLIVTCDSCGKSGETWDGKHPDLAVECDCCPVKHNHGGLGCRTVTITAFANLTILDAGDLLSMMEMRESTGEIVSVFSTESGD